MIERPSFCRIKRYLIGLCFFLVISPPGYLLQPFSLNAHTATLPSFTKALSRLLTVGRKMGISSLEFEIHGTSLQISEMFDHLGRFLPPSMRNWEPQGEMAFDLGVAPTRGHEPARTSLNLNLQLKNVTFSSPDATKGGNRIEGNIHVSLNVPAQQDQTAAFRANLNLEAGEILLSSYRFNLKEYPLRLRLQGAYDPQRQRISSLSAHFHAPPLGEGTIKGTIGMLTHLRGDLKVALGPISNKRAFDLFVKESSGRAWPMLKDLSINGETSLTATIRGSPDHYSVQGWLETSSVDLTIPTHQIAAKGVKIRLPFSWEYPDRGRAFHRGDLGTSTTGFIKGGRIQWKSHKWREVTVPVAFVQNIVFMGQLKLPIWGGRVILDGAEIRDPFRRPREVTLGLKLSQLDISEIPESFLPIALRGSLEGSFPEIRISPERVVTRGSLTAHTLGGQIAVGNIQATSPFSHLPKVTMDVFLRDIHLEEPSLGTVLPSTVVDWKLSGEMALDLALKTGATQESRETRVDLGVQLKNGAFSSPDETMLGEGVQGEINAKLNKPAQQGQFGVFQGNMKLDAGEILLGSLYFNLQHDPLSIRLLGSDESPTHRGPYLSLDFHAPTLGEGTVTATLENPLYPRGVVKVALGPISNERAFDLFVREPFGRASPMLKNLSINGETSLNATIRGFPNHYTIQGWLETSSMNLAIPAQQIAAKGVKIRLPFSLEYPDRESAVTHGDLGTPTTGFFKGDMVQWKSHEWQDVAVRVTLKDSTYFLPYQLKLPIWGGTVILEGATIRDPFGKTLEVTLGLRLNHLDFSEVTKAFVPLALPGSLEGNFPEIRISPKNLVTRGSLIAHTLGGRIEVGSIQAAAPLSHLRKVSMEVLFRDIDLEGASRSFKFGQMGGIIQGNITNLVFSFGQPEKFELSIRSVKKRGIKQYVNAEAVNNLSILSTGTAFPFRRGILQFFRYFPYDKLGIYCKLENDIFTLRGTIHQQGVEYLIKRAPFRGIDVINQNPENRIRWKQMLRRLKAIGQRTEDVKVKTPD